MVAIQRCRSPAAASATSKGPDDSVHRRCLYRRRRRLRPAYRHLRQRSSISLHGARTAWHTHPHGQTIFVTEGGGSVSARGWPRRGDPPRRPGVLRAGREPLARRHAQSPDGSRRNAAGRRGRQCCDVEPPCHRCGSTPWHRCWAEAARPAPPLRFGGRPRLGMGPACRGIRPASSRARRSSISIWALRLRNSSAAHRARASWTAGSMRSSTCLRSRLTNRACRC